MPEALAQFLMAWTDPTLLALTALGTFAGIYVGAIPGLSVTMAVAILISFTYRWDVTEALALMVGIFMGGVYGGARTAILLNMPGAPAAVATALDGYPLAQKGQAGPAIGLSTVMSGVGGFVGIALLAVAAPAIAEFAIRFQPRDYLLIAILGLVLAGALTRTSLAKGLFCAALGVLIGSVGLDPMTAQERMTFGQMDLWNGVSPIVAMIGLFGVAEALRQMHLRATPRVAEKVGNVLPRWRDVRRHLPLSLQTSAIGGTIGALPGTGGDISALLAYDYARTVTRNPEVPFGEGAKEGLVAPESANNAAVGGAFVPMLTLGIPGDAVTAILIGALFIHGLNPGPMLMIETPYIFWFIIGTLCLANIFLMLFGLGGTRLFVRLSQLPRGMLMPVILLLSFVGAYAISNNVADIFWVLGFGVLGFFLKLYGFQVAPVVLGIILSRLIDDNWRRMVISEREDLWAVWAKLSASPLSVTLLSAIVLVLLSRTPLAGLLRRALRRLTPRRSDL